MNKIEIATYMANALAVYEKFEAFAVKRYPALLFRRNEHSDVAEMIEYLLRGKENSHYALMSQCYVQLPRPAYDVHQVAEIYVSRPAKNLMHHRIAMYEWYEGDWPDEGDRGAIIMSWRLTPELTQHKLSPSERKSDGRRMSNAEILYDDMLTAVRSIHPLVVFSSYRHMFAEWLVKGNTISGCLNDDDPLIMGFVYESEPIGVDAHEYAIDVRVQRHAGDLRPAFTLTIHERHHSGVSRLLYSWALTPEFVRL